MTLDVLISTCTPGGIDRVAAMELPVVQGVRYVVTWQRPEGVPVPAALAERSDVEIHRVTSVGLSNNRNEGIIRSKADIWLVADDDLRYTPEGLRSVIDAFGSRHSMDVALFRFEGADGKIYPPEECQVFPYPKDFYPSSIEIAVRRSPRTESMRFDPRFGLASGLFHAGEEDVFLLRGRELGLDIRLIPETITTHEGVSTGKSRITDRKVLAAFGAVMSYHHTLTLPLRLPLKAFRLHRSGQASFITALLGMTRGALYAIFKLPHPWKE